MNDRRKHYRTTCRIKSCIEHRGLLHAEKYCQSGDIGMKGIFIHDLPELSVGSSYNVLIQDRQSEQPLKLNARVTHCSKTGVGFSFSQPRLEDCLRLKHLVKPHWDRNNFLDGLVLMMRYSSPAKELKDALMLTRLLETNQNILFARQSHDVSKCHMFH